MKIYSINNYYKNHTFGAAVNRLQTVENYPEILKKQMNIDAKDYVKGKLGNDEFVENTRNYFSQIERLSYRYPKEVSKLLTKKEKQYYNTMSRILENSGINAKDRDYRNIVKELLEINDK